MKTYFKETSTEEILLSEYLEKDSTDFKCFLYSEEDRIKRTKYLMSILGDVAFDKDTYKLFISEFQSHGGKYDVRTKPDTIKGIYEITRMFPTLTARAVKKIWFRYIKDLFEEHALTSIFEKYIEMFGEEDESFELFVDYVNKKAEQHQQRYIEDALQADELVEEYGESFTKHVKGLITREHYTYDEIKKYLPSAELIEKDEQHIDDISIRTRIFFGCCRPVSYKMLDILLEDKTLDTYPETPTYYISTGGEEQATFTKQEFLDSIKERAKTLEKK